MPKKMNRGFKLLAALLLFGFAVPMTGCAAHHHRARVVHHPQAKAVVIKKGHVHTDRCGHYRHNGRWYFIKGHVHGAKCGHHKVKGVWVVRL